MKLIIGVIGGIGSGKSLVAAELARLGRGSLLLGDQLGHEALRQRDIKDQVAAIWGPGVLDEAGDIERRKLATMVFADSRELRKLEGLTFPYIERRLREDIARAQADPAVNIIVVDAAVMIEAGWDRHCDKILFVDAPAEVRRERLLRMRGWTEKEVSSRESAQLPLAEKRRRANHVIDNSGSPAETSRQLQSILKEWGIPLT